MIFHKHFNNGRKLLPVGMLFLILGLLSFRFLHPSAYLSETMVDAIKGFLMGVAIALNLIAVRLNQRRCA
jgi:hypothetical protein